MCLGAINGKVKGGILLADSWKALYGTPQAKDVFLSVWYKLERVCLCPHEPCRPCRALASPQPQSFQLLLPGSCFLEDSGLLVVYHSLVGAQGPPNICAHNASSVLDPHMHPLFKLGLVSPHLFLSLFTLLEEPTVRCFSVLGHFVSSICHLIKLESG